MKKSKNAEATFLNRTGFEMPPAANSDRLKTLLNEIYQKQAEMTTLAGTILDHSLTEPEVMTIVSQLKRLAERSLHNCDEFELISKTMPSQAN